MIFSEQKRALLREHKEKYISTFIYALIAAALFFVPYMFFDEGYFLLYGDYNVQQIPFYQTCHAAIKSGNFWAVRFSGLLFLLKTVLYLIL